MDFKESREAVAQVHAQAQAVQERTRQVLREADAVLTNVRQGVTDGRLHRLTEEVAGLRRAMETRAVIEQAKGIIIATTGVDADRAFELLASQSQHENRKLHVLAEELVAMKITHRRAG